MANAWREIERWFQNQSMKAFTLTTKIDEAFTDRVQIIWYEVDADEEPISMFTRLNIGKIPLTNAELVKSMLLKDLGTGDERRRKEIALQWDGMEKDLRDDSLWYFLTNVSAEKYQTRIDLVLDLITGKKSAVRIRLRRSFTRGLTILFVRASGSRAMATTTKSGITTRIIPEFGGCSCCSTWNPCGGMASVRSGSRSTSSSLARTGKIPGVWSTFGRCSRRSAGVRRIGKSGWNFTLSWSKKFAGRRIRWSSR